jgi:hypothetical protein
MRPIWWLLVPAIPCLAVNLAAPAQARPRDDALTGAIRCGVVGDSRQWLDCYYGAAQPVRAALGLGSALPAQIKLAASPPAGGPPRDEAVRDQVVSAAAGCMREAGDRPWLDCYYAAAAPMRTQLGLPGPQAAARVASVPAPVPLPVFVPQPPAPPAGPPPMPRNRSLLAGVFNTPKPIVKNMAMQSFVLNDKEAFTVTLADGEVWEQVEEDEVYHKARWRKQASQMEVTIAPDAMHTFVMTVEGEGKIYKVRRIH